MEKLRGLYRYETAPGRWWACAENDKGERVNVIRQRYEEAGITPAFWDLPVQAKNGNGKKKSAA